MEGVIGGAKIGRVRIGRTDNSLTIDKGPSHNGDTFRWYNLYILTIDKMLHIY